MYYGVSGLEITGMAGPKTRLKTYLTTNIGETQPDSSFPELRLRRYDVSQDKLFDIVRDAVERLGWNIASVDVGSRTIHAVATTPFWRFKDDVLVQVRKSSTNASTLYVRSSSRVGQADLGANTRHVLDLIAEVDRAGLGT